MALRLIELILSSDDENVFQEVMKDFKRKKFWYEHGSDNRLLIKIILQAEETEAMLDASFLVHPIRLVFASLTLL